MYKKILIANRGEIACRLARSIRAMGMAVATVHSRPDAGALHVRSIGESVMIGEGPARQSYLNIDAVIAAARQVGADAIHPGFGFLSENPEFAKACADAGLAFIGPRPETLAMFGSKAAAKEKAESLGIPTALGLKTPSEDIEGLLRELAGMPMPFVLKAVSGGGGKGMRVVRDKATLRGDIESAIREARSAFGDGRLIAERYLEAPRHIEVQILGDGKGGVIHLYDRECTLQRRHQKVLEEAPVTSIPRTLREQLWDWSVKLGQSVNYLGLGTVEFAVTAEGPAFLEVNPRLQVEHPVTEMITGLDLVALQIRAVHSGTLPLSQDELPPAQGVAVQARLYAEDATQNFMPSTGRISHFEVPPLVRCDAGVAQGSQISTDYDPMIAKLIAHGPDRTQALHRLHAALDGSCVLGLMHNRSFLLDLIDDRHVVANEVSTEFIDLWLAQQSGRGTNVAELAAIMAAWLITKRSNTTLREITTVAGAASAWQSAANTAWRQQRANSGTPSSSIRLAEGDSTWTIGFGAMNNQGLLPVSVNDQAIMVGLGANQSPRPVRTFAAEQVSTTEPDLQRYTGMAEVNGRNIRIQASFSEGRIDAAIGRHQYILDLAPRFSATAQAAAGQHGMVRSPMMGQVIAVHAKPGDTVEAGQRLATLESMKMELSIKAAIPGVLKWVGCTEQGRVERNQDLFLIEAAG